MSEWLYPRVQKITSVCEDLENRDYLYTISGYINWANIESILKSRDITLPTKVHLVKVMVFPVVMYGCESWTIKKAEC